MAEIGSANSRSAVKKSPRAPSEASTEQSKSGKGKPYFVTLVNSLPIPFPVKQWLCEAQSPARAFLGPLLTLIFPLCLGLFLLLSHPSKLGDSWQTEYEDSPKGSEPPLHVYLLPLHGSLNFQLLQEEWRTQEPLMVNVSHGVPCSWLYNLNQEQADRFSSLKLLWPCPCHNADDPTAAAAAAGSSAAVTPGAGMVCRDNWLDHEGKDRGLRTGLFPRPPQGYQMNLEQYSPDYWMTLSTLTGLASSTVMQRVQHPWDADALFVPFLASASYGIKFKINEKLRKKGVTAIEDEDRVVKTLEEFWEAECAAIETQRDEKGQDIVLHPKLKGCHKSGRGRARQNWKGWETDLHNVILPSAHPWALKTAWGKLAPAHFLMSDFSNPPEEVANLDKDVIVPYQSLMPPYEDDWGPWADTRRTLLFFRGNLDRQQGGKVRAALAELLSGVPGVDVGPGAADADGVREATKGMRSSKFCLCPEGDTSSSARLFDAIMSHCIPVVVSDSLDPPFEEFLDYTEFAVFVPQKLSLRPGLLVDHLQGIQENEARIMWHRLKEVKWHFYYGTPPRLGGAEEMLWRALRRRMRGRSYNGTHQAKRLDKMAELLQRHGLTSSDLVVRPRGLPLK